MTWTAEVSRQPWVIAWLKTSHTFTVSTSLTVRMKTR